MMLGNPYVNELRSVDDVVELRDCMHHQFRPAFVNWDFFTVINKLYFFPD